jgi:CRISPR-associated protein (TIGR02710 family)
VQGRFDDAVARVYRLVEWTAQWLLHRHLAIDTADVPADRLPEGFAVEPGADGKIKLGLFQAWRLLGTVAGPIAEFVDTELTSLQDRVQTRNHSILAHGFEPIGEAEWQRFQSWLEKAFMPLLTSEAKQVGVTSMPQQLPTQQCW